MISRIRIKKLTVGSFIPAVKGHLFTDIGVVLPFEMGLAVVLYLGCTAVIDGSVVFFDGTSGLTVVETFLQSLTSTVTSTGLFGL